MIKKWMLALSFASAMGWAQAAVLLVEDFDDVAALPGQNWIFNNASQPPGVAPGWAMGNPQVFPAQAGAPDAYIASDYLAADTGGVLDNRLFTPLLSLENGAVATFYLRSPADPTFVDLLRYGFTNGDNEIISIESTLTVVPQGEWTLFTLTVGPLAGVSGRLGFIHTGPQESANYVGLDTLRIDTLREPPPTGVPEPASLLIFGLGMAGLAAVRRRR